MKSYMIMEGVEESYGDAISYLQVYPAGSATGTLEDFTEFGRALISNDNALFTQQETKMHFSILPGIMKIQKFPGFIMGFGLFLTRQVLWVALAIHRVMYSGLYFDLESARLVCVMTNELGETAFNYKILGLAFGYLDLDLRDVTDEKISQASTLLRGSAYDI